MSFEGPVSASARLRMGELSLAAFLRLWRAFWEPQKVFSEIGQRPSFFWVVFAQVLLVVLVQMAVIQKVDLEATVHESLVRHGQVVSEEKLAEAVHSATRVRKVAIFLAPLSAVAVLALLGGVYFLSLRLVGSNAEYPPVFSAVAHATWPPSVVQSGLLMLVIAFRSPFSASAIPKMVRSNLAAFLPTDVSPFVQVFAGLLDLFNVWYWVLLVMALREVGEVKTRQATLIVVSLWGTWALVQVGVRLLKG
ncbi:MAG: YIP1 family protein [Thermoanaerobaculaceae bacterium]